MVGPTAEPAGEPGPVLRTVRDDGDQATEPPYPAGVTTGSNSATTRS